MQPIGFVEVKNIFMPQKKKKILITDDDPGMQDAFRLIFEREGFDTTVLSSAKEILSGEAAIPDIYILDKQLSGVDGLDICRLLKSQPHTAHVPVIIVSATPHVASLAKAACADDFLEKPFRRADLLQMVHRYLQPKAA